MDWHNRFVLQASWTHEIRAYLFDRIGLTQSDLVLEVGCGTGSILTELRDREKSIADQSYKRINACAKILGLDLDPEFLQFARAHLVDIPLIGGDAYHLPFKRAAFNHTFCHFLLLWVKDPHVVISEMRRVTKPGGAVLALAEPDYGGRIDYPSELRYLGTLQMNSLRVQGADPEIGRKLASLFSKIGLRDVETGLLGGRWSGVPERQEWESEWKILFDDLVGFISRNELQRLRDLDARAYQQGERILFVPTFFALGIVPD